MKNKISIILNIIFIICICGLIILLFNNTKIKNNNSNKDTCPKSKNTSQYICTRKLESFDNYDIYLNETITVDSNNTITDIVASKEYKISNDAGYKRALELDSNCTDNYKSNKTISCTIDNSNVKPTYMNTWGYSLVNELQKDNFTCVSK